MSAARIAAAYRRFAETEAHGRSPLYETLAHCVADDPDLLARLAALPEAKRQPNLLLAASRHVAGLQPGPAAFRAATIAHWPAIRATILARATQTNEPARCAALLPILAALPQPLALIEVGASAGLCLLPDRYAYDFGRARLAPPPRDGIEPPVFTCRADRSTPLPASLPRIAWRAGLDLDPLDVADAAQMAWLETLVWPGQTTRLAGLRAAIRVARADPPRLVRGDLRSGLAALAAEAPRAATRVIFHTAVLAYLADPAEREDFARTVRTLCDVWIANEAPSVLPGIAPARPPPAPGRFLLSVDGAPVAWTDPHGAALAWIAARNAPWRGGPGLRQALD